MAFATYTEPMAMRMESENGKYDKDISSPMLW